MIQIKRVYEEYAPSDGYRILVDRLWPRGLTKDRAHVDEWAKDIAPSNELRQWFHHEQSNFAEFKTKYLQELQGKKDLLTAIKKESTTSAGHVGIRGKRRNKQSGTGITGAVEKIIRLLRAHG